MSEPQKTVRVRIAVAVNDKGQWSASGASNLSEGESVSGALDWLINAEDGVSESVHFVEAEIPLPASRLIEGQLSR